MSTDKRTLYLERIGAMLRVRRRFTDADVKQVCELALCGLVQTAA